MDDYIKDIQIPQHCSFVSKREEKWEGTSTKEEVEALGNCSHKMSRFWLFVGHIVESIKMFFVPAMIILLILSIILGF
jgi:hypothetical protein